MRIPDNLTTKNGLNTESYYDYMISRYIAPYATIFFKNHGTKNPNTITFLSFIVILLSSVMVFGILKIDSIFYRIIIALLIQISFILDCADGQLARITGKTSKLGAWIDKLLDRVGEFAIFVSYGIVAWLQTGRLLYVFLGIVTGYALSAFSFAMTLSDSIRLENILKVIEIKRKKEKIINENASRKKSFKDTKFALIITKIFFFLNFGIGERYLYLSFFIVINRIDIMLYISAFFSSLRAISILYYVGRKLKKNDLLIKELYE